MNWGLLPTTERIFTALQYGVRSRLWLGPGASDGPLAQLVEQGTLNPKVEGSNPSRPITMLVARAAPAYAVLGLLESLAGSDVGTASDRASAIASSRVNEAPAACSCVHASRPRAS